jgi:hypothetical protein
MPFAISGLWPRSQGHTITERQKNQQGGIVMKQRANTSAAGNVGKKLLMAAILSAGLALTGAAEASAHPGNPPPVAVYQPRPVVYVVKTPSRHYHRPMPPPRRHVHPHHLPPPKYPLVFRPLR